MTDSTTLGGVAVIQGNADKPPDDALAVVLIWSMDEGFRVGELVVLPTDGSAVVIGRRATGPSDVGTRTPLYKQRPGVFEETGPLRSARISRDQVKLEATDRAVRVTNAGRCPLLVNGREVSSAEALPGDVIELKNQAAFLVQLRPVRIPTTSPVDLHPFGEPDSAGIVGEGVASWLLRERIGRVGRRSVHVLIKGPSGSGKELVAAAIHAASASSARPLVARNAATFPSGLIDAELFGNVRDYPNPGMTDRPGLIGQAHQSTLFLDEIGELPHELQAHLLRVLDEGEYQRLGESRARRSLFRLIAATNRSEASLKDDFLARLRVRIEVPDLNQRRADIPLLARHLLRRMCADDPDVARRFFRDENPQDEPRIAPGLVRALVQHHYTTNVRELEAYLWEAVDGSTGLYIDQVDGMRLRPRGAPEVTAPPSDGLPGAEAVQACLDKHDGVQERVWRELGLRNRHVLARLIKKYGLRG